MQPVFITALYILSITAVILTTAIITANYIQKQILHNN